MGLGGSLFFITTQLQLLLCYSHSTLGHDNKIVFQLFQMIFQKLLHGRYLTRYSFIV